jgi:membrane protease YdiL (CAAX protease family)
MAWMRRVSSYFLMFTGFWLIVTVVAFALGHWGAGAISALFTVAGGAGLRYRWRSPLR